MNLTFPNCSKVANANIVGTLNSAFAVDIAGSAWLSSGRHLRMITPQEAAKLVDWPDTSRNKEIHDFVLNASAREIQLFIHSIQTHTIAANDWLTRSRMALDIRLAEDAAKTAEILKLYTHQLVILNRTLVWLTVALLVFTVGFAVFH
jgi:hypothetical protein